MKRIGNLGFDLQDNTKEVSTTNKIVKFHLFNTCKCKHETELENNMFTDNCEEGTGWQYKCICGKINSIWEGAFDNQIENCYENDLVVVSEDLQ